MALTFRLKVIRCVGVTGASSIIWRRVQIPRVSSPSKVRSMGPLVPKSRQMFRSVTLQSQLLETAVAVEKLILGELAKNSLRQDALQTIFSDRVDIFYHRILGRL